MATGKRDPERFQRKLEEFSDSRLEHEINKILRALDDVALFIRRVLKKRTREDPSQRCRGPDMDCPKPRINSARFADRGPCEEA
jgi:hypothetical protein